MKIFNKILAMVLAVLTVLVMLPVNAIADGWLDVDSQTKAEDSTLTVTVSAEKLAAILRENGVSKSLIKELLKDVSVDKNALSKVFTTEELFEIIPKKALTDLIDVQEIIDQLDMDTLIGYIDVRELMKSVDLQALLDLLPDDAELTDILDFDVLVDSVDIDYIIDNDYVDVDALADALLDVLSVDELVDLAGDNLTDVVNFEKLFDDELVELSAEVVSIEQIKSAGLITDALLSDLIDGGALNLTGLETYFKGLANALDYFNTDDVKALIDVADYVGDFDYTGFTIDLSDFVEDDLDTSKFGAGDYVWDAGTSTLTLSDEALEKVKSNPTYYLNDSGMDKLEALVNVDDIYEQINVEEILETVSMTDLAGCLKLEKALAELSITSYINYNAAVTVIGVNTIVDNPAIDVNYDAVEIPDNVAITDYLLDGYLDYIDTEALLDEAEANGIDMMDYVDTDAIFEDSYIVDQVDLESAVDVDAFIDAVNMQDVIDLIGMDAIMEQIDSNEMAELIGSLDIASYVTSALTTVSGKLMANVDRITLDGTVIAGENEMTAQLEFYAGNLVKALLKMIPTLDDIANIENNVVFSTTVGLTYTADEQATTNAGKTKTKNITVELVLEGNLEGVKSAAAELQALLVKYVDFDVAANGDIYLGLDLPTISSPEAVTKLYNKIINTEAIPESIKLKLLDLVNYSGNDASGFLGTLTYDELLTVLDAVEPSALFDAFLNISYVESALEVVGNKLNYDFGNLTLDDVKYAIANVPSIERISEIVENKTGRDFLAILEAAADKIDALTETQMIAKLLDVLEAETGRNFDISVAEVLDRAADVSISEKIAELAARRLGRNVRDILNAHSSDELWDLAIDKAEGKQDTFNKVKNYLDALAAYLPDSLLERSISDLYQGNGHFYLEGSVDLSEKAWAEKLLPKAFRALAKADGLARLLADKIGFDSKIVDAVINKSGEILDRVLSDEVLNKLLAVLPDGTITAHLNVGVQLKDIYRITYMDREGNTVLFSAFLPVGADLSIFKTNSSISGYDIADWTDAEGNPVLTMPAEDTVVYADRNTVTVTFLDADGVTVLGSATLKSGDVIDAAWIAELTGKVKAPNFNEKLYKGFTVSWLDADGKAANLTSPITANATFTAAVELESIFSFDGPYTLEYIDGLYKLTLHSKLADALLIDLVRDYILADAAKDAKAHMQIWIDNATAAADDDFCFISFDNATLAEFYNTRSANGDSVAFSYKKLSSVALEIYKNNKEAAFHSFDILVNGAATAGAFGGQLTVKLPYDRALTPSANAETRVYVLNGNERESVTSSVTNGYVSFAAPHFSDYVISNEYRINVLFQDKNGNAVVDGCTASEPFMPAGATVQIDSLFTYPTDRYVLDSVTVSAGTLNGNVFTMPESAVTVTVTLKPVSYRVYYYVNGTLYGTPVGFEAGSVPAWLDINTVIGDAAIQAPAGYTKDGAAWIGIPTDAEIQAKPGDVYVFAQWKPITYTVQFMAGNTLVLEQTFTVENYLNLTAPAVPNGEAGTVGTWDYEDLATALSKAFTSADNKVVINAVYSNRIFAIAGDGTVIVPDKAEIGQTVTVEVPGKEGHTFTITVVDANNNAITVTDGSFTMPASTVYVSVAYAPVEMSWTVNGESFTGDYGTWHEIRVTIKPGEILAKAPADCQLVSATRNKDGSQNLVYVFQLLREGRSYSWSVVGNPETIFYIFNGAFYDPATAPVSGTENVDFDHWAEGFAGINFATFTTTRTTSYVWLWVMILVLAVIYLIVLIYKLYMHELLGPSIVTRIATAIVSAFFAICLGISAIGLAIARLFGKKEKTEEPAEEAAEEADADDKN